VAADRNGDARGILLADAGLVPQPKKVCNDFLPDSFAKKNQLFNRYCS